MHASGDFFACRTIKLNEREKGGLNQMKQLKKTMWYKSVLIGTGVTCACALMIASILAILMIKEILPLSAGNGMVFLVQSISVFIGIVCAGSTKSKKGIPVSMIVVLCYYFLLISAAMLLFDVNVEGVLVNVLGGMLGLSLATVIQRRKKGSKIKRIKRKVM